MWLYTFWVWYDIRYMYHPYKNSIFFICRKSKRVQHHSLLYSHLIHKSDTTNLDIPSWTKWLKQSRNNIPQQHNWLPISCITQNWRRWRQLNLVTYTHTLKTKIYIYVHIIISILNVVIWEIWSDTT